ncbi:transposase [Streptomyces chumphonensis]|uniref:Transposase n=1 Tax=Streptomyces chumphonensis TaxID=1214925 RepID=A0A927IBP6_9ACTN|nr:transposase [Streptomyces chumphonensis]
MGSDRAVAAAQARAVVGPRPVPDRLCLQGVLYMLNNDIAWQLLPLRIGFGSGQTRWGRLDRWQKAGVFDPPTASAAGQPRSPTNVALRPRESWPGTSSAAAWPQACPPTSSSAPIRPPITAG